LTVAHSDLKPSGNTLGKNLQFTAKKIYLTFACRFTITVRQQDPGYRLIIISDFINKTSTIVKAQQFAIEDYQLGELHATS
jgi:hypothetical protein